MRRYQGYVQPEFIVMPRGVKRVTLHALHGQLVDRQVHRGSVGQSVNKSLCCPKLNCDRSLCIDRSALHVYSHPTIMHRLTSSLPHHHHPPAHPSLTSSSSPQGSSHPSSVAKYSDVHPSSRPTPSSPFPLQYLFLASLTPLSLFLSLYFHPHLYSSPNLRGPCPCQNS